MNVQLDVVIIGAGPAGMSAAIRAAASGVPSILVIDEQPSVGGQIWRNIEKSPALVQKVLGTDYTDGVSVAAAFRRANIRYLPNSVVWDITPEKLISYTSNGTSYQVSAKAVIVATGAYERPFPVPGWVLPGVMGAGAAQVLLKSSAMVPDEEPILVGCGPLIYLLAWQYLRAGQKLKAIVDTAVVSNRFHGSKHALGALRGWRYLRKGLRLLRTIKQSGTPFYTGATDLRLSGDTHVSEVSFKSHGASQLVRGNLVLLHQGILPNVQITARLRARHLWSQQQLCWVPAVNADLSLDGIGGVYVAGDGAGIVGAKAAVYQGELAGAAAAAYVGAVGEQDVRRLTARLRGNIAHETAVRPFLDAMYAPLKEDRIPPLDSTVVCRCEEVTAGNIREFVVHGCVGPNQAKAFGRCGMGPCQGRMCGVTVTELIAEGSRRDPSEVGYYRIRPPIKPITLSELASLAEAR